MEKKIELYGASWCLKSTKIRNHLQRKWIDFTDFDVEDDKAAAERVRSFYEGKLKFPTVVIDGTHYKNPTLSELDKLVE